MVNIWVVRGASGGSLIQDCLNMRRMAIGLRGTSDFRQFENINLIRDHVLETHKGGDSNKGFYGKGHAKYGVQFYSEVEKKDLVLLVSGSSDVVAIGANAGDYRFYDEPQWSTEEANYQHIRKIDWFQINPVLNVPQLPVQTGFCRLSDKNSVQVVQSVWSRILDEEQAHERKDRVDREKVFKLIAKAVKQFDKAINIRGTNGRENTSLISSSWLIISPVVAVKKMDKSCFYNNGSRVPKPVQDIFEFLPVHDQRKIKLGFNGNQFDAYLKSYLGEESVRLHWYKDFADRITESFPQQYDYFLKESGEEPDTAEMRFQKIAIDQYAIDFLLSDQINENTDPEEAFVEEIAGRLEGMPKTVVATRYERDPKNRLEAIRIHGLRCIPCGFDFSKTYGDRGQGYIEIHHINPVSELADAQIVDPVTDLVPVCSNCHRMIHRRKDKMLSIEELREIINQKKTE